MTGLAVTPGQPLPGWRILDLALAGTLVLKSARLALSPDRHDAMANFHASLMQLTLLLAAANIDAGLRTAGASSGWRYWRLALGAALHAARSVSCRSPPTVQFSFNPPVRLR
jgi:hypothetical protein